MPLWDTIELDAERPPKSEVFRRWNGREVSCGGGVATMGIGGKASVFVEEEPGGSEG